MNMGPWETRIDLPCVTQGGERAQAEPGSPDSEATSCQQAPHGQRRVSSRLAGASGLVIPPPGWKLQQPQPPGVPTGGLWRSTGHGAPPQLCITTREEFSLWSGRVGSNPSTAVTEGDSLCLQWFVPKPVPGPTAVKEIPSLGPGPRQGLDGISLVGSGLSSGRVVGWEGGRQGVTRPGQPPPLSGSQDSPGSSAGSRLPAGACGERPEALCSADQQQGVPAVLHPHTRVSAQLLHARPWQRGLAHHDGAAEQAGVRRLIFLKHAEQCSA